MLSETFCQDDVENYFGRQRTIGRRTDNLNVKDTGYPGNTIKSQFSVETVERNVLSGTSIWNFIDDSPLQKKKWIFDYKLFLVIFIFCIFIIFIF